MGGRHPGQQVRGRVTDRIKFGVGGLGAGLQMGELRDGAATQHTDAQKAVAEIDNISNYINEMTYKFITGAEPLTNFDTYMDTLQKMGIENLIQMHQEAYDSFMSRGK